MTFCRSPEKTCFERKTKEEQEEISTWIPSTNGCVLIFLLNGLKLVNLLPGSELLPVNMPPWRIADVSDH